MIYKIKCFYGFGINEIYIIIKRQVRRKLITPKFLINETEIREIELIV